MTASLVLLRAWGVRPTMTHTMWVHTAFFDGSTTPPLSYLPHPCPRPVSAALCSSSRRPPSMIPNSPGVPTPPNKQQKKVAAKPSCTSILSPIPEISADRSLSNPSCHHSTSRVLSNNGSPLFGLSCCCVSHFLRVQDRALWLLGASSHRSTGDLHLIRPPKTRIPSPIA